MHKVLKQCYVKKYDTGYGWRGLPSATCLLAVHEAKSLGHEMVYNRFEKEFITKEEYYAIYNMDLKLGNKGDLMIITRLANKLNILIKPWITKDDKVIEE